MNTGDVDIDFPDRNRALALLDHVPASILRNGNLEKHNTGVYFHAVPMDPVTGYASLPYDRAEQQGWYKIDLLNVSVYEMVRDETHLLSLMSAPLDWSMLDHPGFTENLVHIGNHTSLVSSLKPRSIMDLAMVLALIRPGKKHLVGRCAERGFDSIKHEIWIPPSDGSYHFKKAHSVSYAMLVKVHANLLIEMAS